MKSTDYSNCTIYKIVCKDPKIKDIYIGSTINFTKRMSEHKCRCHNPNCNAYNHYKYKFIRENGGWSNFDMVIIREVNCNSRQELEVIERECIEEFNATLNKQIPSRTPEEIQEYHHHYREKNREIINQKSKQMIECECGCIQNIANLARHKKSEKHKKKMIGVLS